ncbi:MAG: Rieske 2Fe-2S domain-containing protein [Gemmatimonadota bacterium]|nr:Rieske 2Fe-2S domain-containing protein [Gemmatimonadota bacterium]
MTEGQAEEGIMLRQEDVLDEISRLIESLEAHADPVVGEQVGELLRGIDAVHRTALSHLFNAIVGIGGEQFMDRLTGDAAIRMLFMSYDLLVVDRRINTEEALDAVRGHLHSHGVDVELLEVVGSEVFVKLHFADGTSLPVEAVRRDIEAALREGLVGFQILTIGERRAAPKASELVTLGGLRRANRPVYHSAFPASELEPGEMRAIEAGSEPVLIANIGGEFYAVRDRCGDAPLPLSYSALSDAVLVCSWHGCRYDLRSGARDDSSGGDRIRVYPVRVENGMVEVAVGVEPMPREGPANNASSGEGG